MGAFISSTLATGPVQAAAKPKEVIKRETVVIPIDPSKQAETAFEWYMRHVHRPENYVYIVHCQELEHPSGADYPDYAVPPEAFVEQYEKASKMGKSTLEKYEQKLQKNGMRGRVHAVVGRPGEVVVDAANKYNASMIIMGSRGYGLIRRTVLGSVSEYVIHHTSVPVTIVPPETQHWLF